MKEILFRLKQLFCRHDYGEDLGEISYNLYFDNTAHKQTFKVCRCTKCGYLKLSLRIW